MTDEQKKAMIATLAKAAETLDLAAQHYRDKGHKTYTAALHAQSMGFALKQAVAGGMEPTSDNFTMFIHATFNQSRWRQTFEAKGYFPKAAKRTLEMATNELEEEFGEG